MTLTLAPDTLKLIEQRMQKYGLQSADEAVRAALLTLNELESEPSGRLDPETLAAIEQAEAEAERGEGIPADEAFAMLRRKHFGA
ncbi:MAG TPA: hypothetical protein VF796_00090 [Humisphaera sp.]